MLTAILAAAATAATACIAVAAHAAPAGAPVGAAVDRTLDNGDRVVFDGVSQYDFRDADGQRMVKVWVPPDAPVRGLIVMGHGGGTGDSRGSTREANLQALAARFGFGVAGLHRFPGGEVYENGAAVFFDALAAFADLGPHPELANVPIAAFGSSNGGGTAYGLANARPDRVLCFTSNVMWRFTPTPPAEGATSVPGAIIVGRFDNFASGQQGVDETRAIVDAARREGARWAFVVEDKGHEDGVAFDVFAQLLESAVDARYPHDADPSAGPIELRDVPEADGWLVGHDNAEGVPPAVAPFDKYAGDKAAAGWALDADLAQVLKAARTRNSPLSLGVQEVGRGYNPNTAPGTMWSVGGPTVEPGRQLTLVADVRDIPNWKSVWFYDGATKLGKATAPGEPTLQITALGDARVMCLTAFATDAGVDFPHAAGPFYLAVSPPRSEPPEPPAYELGIDAFGARTTAPADYALPEDDAVLVAFGLTPDQEQQFGADARAVAPFWADIPDERGAVLDQQTHAQEGQSFSIVTLADARMTMKAARSRRGLYLYFEVRDNEFVAAEPVPGKYNETDAVDVLLDAHPSAWLNDPANRAKAVNASWALFLSTTQYQVAFGGDNGPPPEMRRLAADPFDFDFTAMHTIDGLRRERGIVVRHVKLDRLRRAQEWFLPWTELGRAPGDEPAVGTRFGFAPGYKDFDVSGESAAAAAKTLRWVGRSSPWQHSAHRGEPPRGWGDLEIGPMLEAE